MHWRERFESEIQKAERARQRGNEGQARVCARRAAGIVGLEFLTHRGTVPASRNSMDVLRQLSAEPSFPPDLAQIVEHFMLPVDRDFRLPPGIDLIAEAAQLAQRLLPR